MPKIELKVPDLWFDFYARLLPGAAFVGAAYCLLSSAPKAPNSTGIMMALVCGYLCALVSQPVSSRVTRLLQERVALARAGDKLYVEKVQKGLDERQSMILSKMHGETTFFVQCAILGGVLLLLLLLDPPGPVPAKSFALLRLLRPPEPVPAWKYAVYGGICVGLFLSGAWEIAERRVKRARDQKALQTWMASKAVGGDEQ